MIWDGQCLEDSEQKDNSMKYDEGVCRTAPATPGLLNTLVTY